MRKLVACPLSWLLFSVQRAISVVLDFTEWLYQARGRLLSWSMSVQIWGGLSYPSGPWGKFGDA